MQKSSPTGYGTTFWVGIAVACVLALALVSFLPIATCPNCKGRGSVSGRVNDAWQRAHPGVLFLGPRVEKFGVQNCIRCNSRGRVSILKTGEE